MPVGRPKGQPKTGGRKKGTPNHATVEIKELARSHCADAIAKIVSLMHSAVNEQVQMAAAKELIDRGYGKAVQAIEADVKAEVCIQVVTLPLDDKL